MAALHSKQTTVEGIHTSVALIYANQAARLAAGSFVSADVGKIAWQQSDNTYWMLASTSPSWVELTASTVLVPGTVTALGLVGSQNNLNPTNWNDISKQTIFISTTTDANLTGIQQGAGGRHCHLVNVGSTIITLAHESASSTAANRFTLPGGTSVSLRPGAGFSFIYYATTSRWVAMAGNASTLNVGTTAGTVAAGDDARFLKNTATMFDRWRDAEPHRVTTLVQDDFTIAVLGGGLLNNASYPITDAMQEGRNLVWTIRSNTAAAHNGVRFYTENTNLVLFGGANQQRYVFTCRFWLEALTGRQIIAGFHDATAGSAEPVDGAYLFFNGTNCAGKTASNSVRSTTATTFTPLATNWYSVVIETTISPSNLVTFSIYDETGGGTLVWSDTLSTNLPQLVARGVAVAVIMTYTPAAAINIGCIAHIGHGTRASYIQKTQGA